MADHRTIRPAEYLEFLIDRESVGALLDYVATICHEKAEHIRSTWQDRPLAKTWDDAGKIIEKVSTRVSV